MSLQEISSIVGIAGNVAVATTLGFLAYQLKVASAQLRESKVATKYQLWNTLHEQSLTFFAGLIASGTASLYHKGRLDPESLTPEESCVFFYLCVSWFTIHEHFYSLKGEEYIPLSFIAPWISAFEEDLRDPGFIWFWEKERHLFDGPFQVKVDKIVRECKSQK